MDSRLEVQFGCVRLEIPVGKPNTVESWFKCIYHEQIQQCRLGLEMNGGI